MEIHDWIVAQRQTEILVSTAGIIANTLSLNNNFKYKQDSTLRSWDYRFFAHWNLLCRMITHVGQKHNEHLIEMKIQFVTD